jgi:hypothetical protein
MKTQVPLLVVILVACTTARADNSNLGEMKQVTYATPDGHIWEFCSPRDTQFVWTNADLTAVLHAPVCAVPPTLCSYSWFDLMKQVVYLSSDNHIIEMCCPRETCVWHCADLTKLTHSESHLPITGNVVGYGWGNHRKQVTYIGTDHHVHELCYAVVDHAWIYRDLTQNAQTNAQAVPGNLAAFVWGQGKQVLYLTIDGHVHELSVSNQSPTAWHDTDLTQDSGTSSRAILDPKNLAGYVFGNFGSMKCAVYLTADHHVHQLVRAATSSHWHDVDLTIQAKAPAPAIPGTLLAYQWGIYQQVVYLTGDNHIHELCQDLYHNSDWHDADLTGLVGQDVGVIPGTLDAFGMDDRKQVVYLANDHHVHELCYVNQTSWTKADLSAVLLGSHSNVGQPVTAQLSGYDWMHQQQAAPDIYKQTEVYITIISTPLN